MTNKTNWLGIIALVCAAAFTGCPTEDEALVRKELYGVKITSVTPDLIAGVKQEVEVTVEYNLQVNLSPNVQLIVAFNTIDLDEYIAYGDIDMKKGSGIHTFNTTITPADWSAHGAFQVRAFYGFKDRSIGGHEGYPAPGAVLASDTKAIPLRQEGNYWTVTWYLNGGERDEPILLVGRYPGRVAKGAVLARPRVPYKTLSVDLRGIRRLYFFGGWYTDSALTQPYNFANSVTADLNLYAKWQENPSVELLYDTWYNPRGNYPWYSLTITADTLRLENRLGEYIQYTNVVWTQSADRNNDFTFTGIREESGTLDDGSISDSDLRKNIGHVSRHISAEQPILFLGQSETTPWRDTVNGGSWFELKEAYPTVTGVW